MKRIPFIAALTLCIILALGSLATAISIGDQGLESRTRPTALNARSAPIAAPRQTAFDPSDATAWTPLLLSALAAAAAAVVLRRATA